jgi:hypothetical protein
MVIILQAKLPKGVVWPFFIGGKGVVMEVFKAKEFSITVAAIVAFLLISMPTDLYAQEDTTPPELVEFDFNPKTIDVSAGSQDVTFTLRLTDDLSGLNHVSVGITSPSGSLSRYQGATGPITGDRNDGIYEVVININQYYESGIWHVKEVRAQDEVNNSIIYSETELSTMGFPTELEVVSVSDTDGDGIPDDQDDCPDEDATGFDTDQDGCIDNLTGLNDMLEKLVEQGVIEAELKNSLLSKVATAEKSADKENIEAAVNKLEALINEINAQRGKKISEEAAEELITYTGSIINWLSNQLP